MSVRPRTYDPRALRRLARLFWLCALVGHAPALLSACDRLVAHPTDADAILRGLALAVSSLFFALKILDVPWLRLVRDRQSLLAAAVVVALLHAGVAQRAARDGRLPDLQPFAAVLVSGGLLTLAGGARVMLGAAQAGVRRGTRARRAALHVSLLERLGWLLPPRFLLLARACAVNRAPPR